MFDVNANFLMFNAIFNDEVCIFKQVHDIFAYSISRFKFEFMLSLFIARFTIHFIWFELHLAAGPPLISYWQTTNRTCLREQARFVQLLFVSISSVFEMHKHYTTPLTYPFLFAHCNQSFYTILTMHTPTLHNKTCIQKPRW